MSVVSLDANSPCLSRNVIERLGADAGITIKPEHVSDFQLLLRPLDADAKDIMAADHYDSDTLADLQRYPRTNIHIPEDTDKGGWATKCTTKSVAPTSTLLQGRSVALKDNIALAGVRCTNGTAAMDWTPKIDATVATRIMDAGGVITGKAACENACLEGVSDTSVTGKVHNPYADGNSCGGSSSGCARLVASGSVDMAVGCDQGGSIRIPASMCGIVGLKPTWGLVPYTGIISGECTIDHAGPMARSVRDTAILLQAIAGSDGIDDRQPPYLPPGTLDYVDQLDAFLLDTTTNKPLQGVKIGVLEEGFAIPNMQHSIHHICSQAVEKLRSLGAIVTNVSIPAHARAAKMWMYNVPIAGGRQGLLSDMTGRKQLYMTDRIEKTNVPLKQETFDALGPAAQNLYLRHLYLKQEYGPPLHARVANALRKIGKDYDNALQSVDVLVMPTLPSPACKLFDDPEAHGPLERLTRNVGLVGNTAPFNSSGHPALTIPVGFAPAREDSQIMLPVGLQIVGKKFHDIDCLKVGAAWDRACDWKAYRYTESETT